LDFHVESGVYMGSERMITETIVTMRPCKRQERIKLR